MSVMFKKGTVDSSKIMLGSTEINKIMYRNNIVWEPVTGTQLYHNGFTTYLTDAEAWNVGTTLQGSVTKNTNNVEIYGYRNSGQVGSYGYGACFTPNLDLRAYSTIKIKGNVKYLMDRTSSTVSIYADILNSSKGRVVESESAAIFNITADQVNIEQTGTFEINISLSTLSTSLKSNCYIAVTSYINSNAGRAYLYTIVKDILGIV